MRRTDLFWLAAMIEAEGGVYYCGNDLRVQFYNSNYELHQQVARLTGAAIYRVKFRKKGLHKKPHWTSYLSNLRAVKLIEKIFPIFSLEKQEQAALALLNWGLRNTKRGRPVMSCQ
jgi:hypothetical protein